MAIVLTVVSVVGCTAPKGPSDVSLPSAEDTLGLLRGLFGPHGAFVIPHQYELHHDLNGDGVEETIFVFFDQGFDDQPPTTLAELRDGLTCNGFAVLTRIDQRMWPVFYYYNQYRLSLYLKPFDGVERFVSQGGRDHVQTEWGWYEHPDWPPPRWDTRFRVWESQHNRYSNWRVHRFFNSVYGK